MYSAAMAETKGEIVHVRVTPFIKRLLAGVVKSKGFNSEATAIDAVIRAYAETRKIEALSEADFAVYEQGKARKNNRTPKPEE